MRRWWSAFKSKWIRPRYVRATVDVLGLCAIAFGIGMLFGVAIGVIAAGVFCFIATYRTKEVS